MSDSIRAYSQRLLPPYSGQIQIAESERARAITMDCETWEIHFLHAVSGDERKFRRAALVYHSDLQRLSQRPAAENSDIDERILELIHFLAGASLPFPAADIYEYWLLDREDDSPLALIFTCTEAGQMASFPSHPEWTALPAAVMPIETTEEEKQRSEPPVNYRLERLVAERAGYNPRARWFTRRAHEPGEFPTLLVREDWPEAYQRDLCQRYLQRQAPRLLMMHWLPHADRRRLELSAKDNVREVERFYPLYPEVADEQLMNAMRVEARLRGVTGEKPPELHKRRDGIHYL